MEHKIDWLEIQGMISHWLRTPENGYLGSNYGYRDRIIRIVQEPYNESSAQDIIVKMQQDIPALASQDVGVFWAVGEHNITITANENSAIFPIESSA
jgi:hypothetical protein